MKKQIALPDQFAKIDVDCPPEAVPAREAFFLLALDVPERIADVLEIEPDTSLLQPRSFAVPLSEQMAVRALARFMAVRPSKCFFLRYLGICRSRENARAEQQEKKR
jgi:hypothetical protein